MNWLLDIEGTTTSISFVYDVLFPFARRELAQSLSGRGFLDAHWDLPEVQEAARLIGTTGAKETAAAAIALMNADVKHTGLKILQGLVWQVGYERGEILGHVYADVPGAFERAFSAGVPIAIYSSGSVQAQKLIFGHSEAGDLSRFVGEWFDTTTGHKKSADSYRAIAEALDADPPTIVFATDNVDEARAAQAAGVTAWLAVRPGNAPLPDGHGFPTFMSLAELPLHDALA